MNPHAPRRTVPVACALAFAAALTGCGSGDSGGSGAAHVPDAPPAPSAAAPLPTDPLPSDPPDDAPDAPARDVPRPDGVDLTDADEVSRGALTALWSHDTAVDNGPHDAGRRAADAGWLTPEYARQVRAHQPRAVPGARWEEWADREAHTTVALERTEDAAIPADTDVEAWRQWTVTATPHGRGGWTGEPATSVAFVQLTREAAGAEWRVARVDVR